MKHAGFIINSRVPALASLRKGMRPHALLTGWDDAGSPMSFMRFRWVAEALRNANFGWRYELYRPFRKYDAVVFLKSMGPQCQALATKLRGEGVCVLFEANVDYYTRFEGEPRLDVMAPTAAQRSDAVAITQAANAVIASSRHLAGVCQTFNPRTTWVPDNVRWDLRPATVQQEPFREGRLQVWWSGIAAKLFEFLAAEDCFLSLADRIHLHLVTDDIEKARPRWPLALRERLERFLARVPHTVHRFRSIPHLLSLYGGGGVIVSPRFLDTPYNLSHTEWKISLGVACALPAIASPVPSYIDLAGRCAPGAVAICHTDAEWMSAFQAILSNQRRLREVGGLASESVKRHYETTVVAREHALWVDTQCAGAK